MAAETYVNKFADDVPVSTSELADAMRVSRWTIRRWKEDGYQFEFGRRTTTGHLKAWLREQALKDQSSSDEEAVRFNEVHSRLP